MPPALLRFVAQDCRSEEALSQARELVLALEAERLAPVFSSWLLGAAVDLILAGQRSRWHGDVYTRSLTPERVAGVAGRYPALVAEAAGLFGDGLPLRELLTRCHGDFCNLRRDVRGAG